MVYWIGKVKEKTMPYTNTERQKEKRQEWKADSRKRLKQYVLDYLKTHPCVDCGQTNPLVLDFDHRDPAEKDDSIARIVSDTGALPRLLAEIEKCDVRCSNCHRIRHAANRSVHITKKDPEWEMPLDARERIRQSKLGKPRSEETKAKISQALQGNHCRKIRDLTGQVFGRLTVLRQGQIKPMNGGTRVYWWCQCSCGSPEKEISGIKMITGSTKSCGCLRREFQGNQFTASV
jgi:hypothetical protein